MSSHPFLCFLRAISIHSCPFSPVSDVVSSHGGFFVSATLFIHEAPEETEVVAAVGVADVMNQFVVFGVEQKR